MRHILVVDDAVLIRALLRDVLRREGYVVHEAVSCRDALARYEEIKPDAVTMDVSLPDGSGLSCISQMLETDPAARVVVVTALSHDVQARAAEAGARGFVGKPFRPEEIVEALRSTLSTTDDAAAASGIA